MALASQSMDCAWPRPRHQVLGLGIESQVLGLGLDNQVFDNNTGEDRQIRNLFISSVMDSWFGLFTDLNFDLCIGNKTLYMLLAKVLFGDDWP